MAYISKVQIKNFKKFENFSIELSNSTNLIIGDNESGKSTILTAIDLVLSASRHKIESISLEALFNKEVIDNFLLLSDRKVSDLPTMQIDLYISGTEEDPDFNGKDNLNHISAYGIKLCCEPNDEYSEFIEQSLKNNSSFPFEFYKCTFSTFAGSSYSKYKKIINYVLLDHSNVNSEYATNEYVKKVYGSIIDDQSRTVLRNKFNNQKSEFNNEHLINHKNNTYSFALRAGSKFSLENNITILESNIPLEHRGKGKQCFIKADFVLNKDKKSNEIDLVMLEEPENHLSHSNMKMLLENIISSTNKQIIVTTHNNLIASRLDLRNSILLNSNNNQLLLLKNLDIETANFFTKAPNNNVLQYILSSKVILVEGDAEYILIDEFFKIHKNLSTTHKNIHIISVGGLSFKRYLEIAKILNIKTVVITDNDSNYKENITDKYETYVSHNHIKIFSEENPELSTFEICLYKQNNKILDDLINKSGRVACVQDSMLKNKSSSALKILDALTTDADFKEKFVIPQYIKDAIEWISK